MNNKFCSSTNEELNNKLLLAIEYCNKGKIMQAFEAGAEEKLACKRLGHASYFGNLDSVKLLVTIGIDIDKTSWLGSTPFIKAAEGGRVKIVEFLLKTGKIDINKQDIFGSTPLRLAVLHYHPEVVKILLEHGADHSKRGMAGRTLLGEAILREENLKDSKERPISSNIIKLLLASGADPGAKNSKIIREYLEERKKNREIASETLKEVIPSQLSLELPIELTKLIVELAY